MYAAPLIFDFDPWCFKISAFLQSTVMASGLPKTTRKSSLAPQGRMRSSPTRVGQGWTFIPPYEAPLWCQVCGSIPYQTTVPRFMGVFTIRGMTAMSWWINRMFLIYWCCLRTLYMVYHLFLRYMGGFHKWGSPKSWMVYNGKSN